MCPKLLTFLLLAVIGFVPARSSSAIRVYSDIHYGTNGYQAMDIYVPETAARHIGIILIHGGAGITGDKSSLSDVAMELAGMGYPVMNINYRLVYAGRPQFILAVDDVKAAAMWIKTNKTMAPLGLKALVSFGTSSGGTLALFLGTTNLVQTVVDFYGPTDLTNGDLLDDSFSGYTNAEILGYTLGYDYEKDPAIYKEASPVTYLTKKMPPTIIYHGTADTTVPDSQSIELEDDLAKLDVACELHLLQGYGHGFLTSPQFDKHAALEHIGGFIQAAINGPYAQH